MITDCIIIFIKSLLTRQVKSRLAKDIGPEAATAIYQCFVDDTLRLLEKSAYPFIIAYYPPAAEIEVKQWLGEEYNYFSQQGNDLGENMKNAFYHIFNAGFSRVLLTGSDIPDLPPAVINEAFLGLETSDAVIGPSLDGGYYLIGFNETKFLPDIFENIKWSTPTVFQETMTIFQEHNYHVHKLTGWRDVDDFADLKALYNRNRNTAFADSATINFIKNTKIFPLQL